MLYLAIFANILVYFSWCGCLSRLQTTNKLCFHKITSITSICSKNAITSSYAIFNAIATKTIKISAIMCWTQSATNISVASLA